MAPVWPKGNCRATGVWTGWGCGGGCFVVIPINAVSERFVPATDRLFQNLRPGETTPGGILGRGTVGTSCGLAPRRLRLTVATVFPCVGHIVGARVRGGSLHSVHEGMVARGGATGQPARVRVFGPEGCVQAGQGVAVIVRERVRRRGGPARASGRGGRRSVKGRSGPGGPPRRCGRRGLRPWPSRPSPRRRTARSPRRRRGRGCP